MFSIRGCLPVSLPDTVIGADSRLRDPAVQAEIDLRVPLYADQVAQYRRIRRWLPKRGTGKSARHRAPRKGEVDDDSVSTCLPVEIVTELGGRSPDEIECLYAVEARSSLGYCRYSTNFACC